MEQGNVEQRLVKCFEAVFPSLSEQEIRQATPANVKEWDSIAAITLVTVMEEEFETQLDFEVMAEQDSFPKIAQYLSTL